MPPTVPIATKPTEVTLIGRSEAMRAIEADIECAARSDAKVLITGETGVGKEVVARLIHHRSARAAVSLVTLNCAGLPDSLLESELFGHARGSFTGAYRDKPGLLEMAPHGTVLLDEVGEMSVRMQGVLLRFVETGEIQRLGSDRPHTRVNVRLMTATNRELSNQIATGAFREDLYFRLNVIRVSIPPLRERLDDIPVLVDHYLVMYSDQHRIPQLELSPQALDALIAYRWPGNIRELRNVIERAVLRANGPLIRPSDLPSEIFGTIVTVGSVARESPASASVAEQLLERMLVHGESFWSAVYPAFMSRDITRNDLRTIVQAGLEHTNGSYRQVVQLFNIPSEDYKRLLTFLRKHECHLPFQTFRTAPARLYANMPHPGAVVARA
jgi:transcriptional regulator with GAF, ATPase, and Fis domain